MSAVLWNESQLGSVCEVIAGQSPKSSAYNDSGKGLPFYQGKTHFTDRYLAPAATWTTTVTKRARPRDILMSVRAPVGPINEATEEICIGRGLAAIRAKASIDHDFLWYALLWLQPKIIGNAGAVFPSINKGSIERLSLPLPPLDVQRRIVAALDQAFAALDRARANAEANLADAQELFGSALNAVVRRCSHQQQKKLRLGSIVTRLTNGYVGPIRNIYVDEGVPYLLARHVRDNTLTFDGRTYISPAFNEKHKKSKLKAGDVLLVQSGHIGHSAVVPEKHAGHNCHAMIVISPVDNIVSGPYLSMMFNTPAMREVFQNIRTGSTVPHLTCKMVKELTLDIPPREVQDRIMAHTGKLHTQTAGAMARYEEDISDIAALRQSLLQKAFAGEL